MGKHVFVLGATGYIGGAVLLRYKASFPDWTFAALCRNAGSDAALEQAGVSHVIRGSHSDLDIIRAQSAKADVVLAAADCDDLELARAVLEGLAERVASGKQPGILIHTSGTGVVSDSSHGAWSEYANKIWNDANEDDIRSIPEDKPHRPVDLLVFDYIAKKLVNAYIIAPSTIYGVAKAPVHTISQQIPNIIRADIRLKKAVIVGPGTNVWNNVHINDLIQLYDLILKRALADADTSASPYARFYFGSVGRHVFGDVQRSVGELLYEKGLVANKKAERVEFDELVKENPLLKYVANNSQSKADRGYSIGWTPNFPSLIDTLAEDVDATLKEL